MTDSQSDSATNPMAKALARRRAVESVARQNWDDARNRESKVSLSGRTRGPWEQGKASQKQATIDIAEREVARVEAALAAEGLYDLPPRVGGRKAAA